ncbi:MAG: Uma2 family endonuclease [Deltaproteobacteria bacterium]|nr:Uma2 family endonuclease [Deltaproteobacteria bacterium]
MTNAAQQQPLRGVLVPRPHELPEGAIPFYDHELDVPQSLAHRVHTYETGLVLSDVAKEAGLLFMSDEPIWYLHPENDEQRVYYGDFVFATGDDTSSITADSLLLVIEVVSSNDRRRELKDTYFSRLLNERNSVPELGLIFPEIEDARALTWFALVDGRYQEHAVAPGGAVASRTVPGLELRVLPRDRWQPGYKVDVYYRGELRPRFAAERERALAALQRAGEAEQRAGEAEQRAGEAEQRAARMAARLRELGIDPDA